MTDWSGLMAWMRETLAESKARDRVSCPRCALALDEVGGVRVCPFGHWRSDWDWG